MCIIRTVMPYLTTYITCITSRILYCINLAKMQSVIIIVVEKMRADTCRRSEHYKHFAHELNKRHLLVMSVRLFAM